MTLSHTDVGSVSWHTVTLQVLRYFVNVAETCEEVEKVVAFQPTLVLIDLITQL